MTCAQAQLSAHVLKKQDEARTRRANKNAGLPTPPKTRQPRGPVLPVPDCDSYGSPAGPSAPPKNKINRDGSQHKLRSQACITGASWNAAHLKHRTMDNIASLGHDICCLQETHIQDPQKHSTARRFFSLAATETGDPAAGTAIFLSKQAARCVSGSGAPSTRICWVRLRTAGPSLFVISAYIPHAGRKGPPFRDDTYGELEQLLLKVPPGDCVWVCLDANSRLQRNMLPYTGPHAVHCRADEWETTTRDYEAP